MTVPADESGSAGLAEMIETAEVPPVLRSVLVALADRFAAPPWTADLPPGVCPVVTLPLDGQVLVVVRHPGRPSAEPPLALFDPDRFVATYLGVDLRRSIGVLLGLLLADAPDAAGRAAVEAVADEAGFDAAQLPAEMPLDVHPRVPPGWRLAHTADGLGVMAPIAWFAPDQLFDIEAAEVPPPVIDLPVLASPAADRFPASTLWMLHNAIAWAEPIHRPRLLQAMRAVHVRLISG